MDGLWGPFQPQPFHDSMTLSGLQCQEDPALPCAPSEPEEHQLDLQAQEIFTTVWTQIPILWCYLSVSEVPKGNCSCSHFTLGLEVLPGSSVSSFVLCLADTGVLLFFLLGLSWLRGLLQPAMKFPGWILSALLAQGNHIKASCLCHPLYERALQPSWILGRDLELCSNF